MSGDYSQYYEQYWNYAAWQNYGGYYDPYTASYGEYGSIEESTDDAKESAKEDFEPVGK